MHEDEVTTVEHGLVDGPAEGAVCVRGSVDADDDRAPGRTPEFLRLGSGHGCTLLC
jgi:hypothetical protein